MHPPPYIGKGLVEAECKVANDIDCLRVGDNRQKNLGRGGGVKLENL